MVLRVLQGLRTGSARRALVVNAKDKTVVIGLAADSGEFLPRACDRWVDSQKFLAHGTTTQVAASRPSCAA